MEGTVSSHNHNIKQIQYKRGKTQLMFHRMLYQSVQESIVCIARRVNRKYLKLFWTNQKQSASESHINRKRFRFNEQFVLYWTERRCFTAVMRFTWHTKSKSGEWQQWATRANLFLKDLGKTWSSLTRRTYKKNYVIVYAWDGLEVFLHQSRLQCGGVAADHGPLVL